jgi:hypothetical protein
MTCIAASLRELAEPRSADEFIKDAIDRAAKRAGLNYWRAFDIWYGKARQIRDFEITAVLAALEKKQREAARNEFHELKSRLTILESRLTQIDPDFHRPTIDQAREQMRQLGAMARPGTRGSR